MSSQLIPRREIPHLLSENQRTAPPSKVVFFDTEAYPIEEGKEIHYQFYLACAEYINLSRFDRDPKRRIEERTFLTPSAFWDWLDKKTWTRVVLYVYAHNIAFDLSVLDYEYHLKRLGWRLSNFYVDSGNQILEVIKEKKKIRFISTGNYIKVPLVEIGKLVGIPKIEIESYKPQCITPIQTDSGWKLEVDSESEEFQRILEYCKNDVKIIRNFMLSWIRFIKENDLGNYSETLAGQAFNAFRHRFMKTPLYIHSNPKYDVIEMSAYKGGRVECFRLGRYTGDTFYKLDINSMYPYIMRHCRIPVRLIAQLPNLPLEDYLKLRRARLFIAQCKIKTEVPCVAKRIDGKLIFPVGEFTETLTSPEIDLLLNEGGEVELGEILLYQDALLFSDYVDFFYEKRKEYKRQGNNVYEKICKLLMNSLYGKFGQKGVIYEPLDVEEVDPWELEPIYNQKGEKMNPMIYLLGKYYIQIGKRVSLNSFIAVSAFITAYARCLLWNFIKKAGLENVFYCDTDSLFVNTEGYQRLLPYIDQDKLGYLKVEAKTKELVLKGNKHYEFGEVKRLKGVRKNAHRLGEDTYEQEQWPSFKSVIKKQLSGNYVVRKIVKHTNTPYEKGLVTEEGRVLPLRLLL